MIGRGRVAIYDFTDPLALIPLRYLVRGDVYDLGSRQVLEHAGFRLAETVFPSFPTPSPEANKGGVIDEVRSNGAGGDR